MFQSTCQSFQSHRETGLIGLIRAAECLYLARFTHSKVLGNYQLDAFNSHNSTCCRLEICHQTQTHFKQPSTPFCGSTMLHIKIDPQCCTSKLIHIKHHFITHVSTRLLERSWKLTSRYLQRMRAYNPACSKNIQLYAKLFAKGSFMVRSFSVVNKSVQAARHCLAKPFPIPILSC